MRRPEGIVCPEYKRRLQGKGYASIQCKPSFCIGFSNFPDRSIINTQTLNLFFTQNNPVLERNKYMEKYCKKDYKSCRFYNE